jgi:divalent metal cation (Fe/Co/Zn/Cd) transporter
MASIDEPIDKFLNARPRNHRDCAISALYSSPVPTTVKHHRKAISRGRKLEYFTIAWNSIEALVAVVAGALAGSVSMIGFGADSLIEVVSGSALLWRMAVVQENPKRKRRERIALKIVSSCFIALAIYISFESITTLVHKKKPESSLIGIVIACLSLIIMPFLSHLKRKVAKQIDSVAMQADARQTQFSLYLSIILLAGLVANATLGWWWADPLCALAMVPLIAKEGFDNLMAKN